MTHFKFDDLEDSYNTLWATMIVNPDILESGKDQEEAEAISKHAARYSTIGDPLGIPWPVIGFLHEMECSLDFTTHLHNGDHLSYYTHQVPIGRPKVGHGPPFTFEESAADALKLDGLDKWGDGYWWTVAAILYNAEVFNGTGYRNRGINSPYLWAGSNHYQRGKFVKDGIYSATAVSHQIGVAVLLKVFIDGGLWTPEEPDDEPDAG